MTQTTSAATGAGEIEELRVSRENWRQQAYENLEVTHALRDALAALRDENSRLRKALEPFIGPKLPSSGRSLVDYDLNGLRRAMSPLELAMVNAYRAWLPPMPLTGKPCVNCDSKPNCFCARAALSEKPAAEKEVG